MRVVEPCLSAHLLVVEKALQIFYRDLHGLGEGALLIAAFEVNHSRLIRRQIGFDANFILLEKHKLYIRVTCHFEDLELSRLLRSYFNM